MKRSDATVAMALGFIVIVVGSSDPGQLDVLGSSIAIKEWSELGMTRTPSF